jgi:hypothetical protein
MRLPSASCLGLSVLFLSSAAGADEPAGRSSAGPPADASPSTASSSAPAAPSGGAVTGGYSFTDGPGAAASRAHRARYRQTGPVVQLPGFEMTADGASRVFVQLSESVKIEEKRAGRTLTYVLHGASPRVWNNTNPLVTVHFDTPVSQARLVARGNDLQLVIDLRADAAPTWKTVDTKDKGVMLVVEFPKGDFLGAAAKKEPAKAPKSPDKKPAAKP